jgi:hypothetical protein
MVTFSFSFGAACAKAIAGNSAAATAAERKRTRNISQSSGDVEGGRRIADCPIGAAGCA